MSLNRLFLRAAVVRTLMNRTIAEGRVYDSKLSPLQHQAAEDNLPSICVYTESDVGQNQQETAGGRPTFVRDVDLQIEITIGTWAKVEVPVADGNPELVDGFEIAASDPELEALLDLLEFQIKGLLLGDSDEAHTVARLVRKWTSWNSLPGRTDEGNNKICARQVVIAVALNDDCHLPVDGSIIARGPKGATLFPPLERQAPWLIPLLQHMAGFPQYASLVDLLMKLDGTKPLPAVPRLRHVGFNAAGVEAPIVIEGNETP